jgi:O-methyltransferase involved in polyketide biosynthesis
MARAAAKTGAMPAVIVAIEQRFPKDQRIIADDLAYSMLPFGMKAFVWLMRPAFARDWMVRTTEKAAPGIWALMALPEALYRRKADRSGRRNRRCSQSGRGLRHARIPPAGSR